MTSAGGVELEFDVRVRAEPGLLTDEELETVGTLVKEEVATMLREILRDYLRRRAALAKSLSKL